MGHLGVQFAKKKGLKVIGIDARDDGLQVSEALGADVVIDARKGQEEVVKQVHEATREASPGNPGVDATVTLSDASTAAALGCAITKKHATMIQIAQPKDVVIPFSEFVFRDVRVKGSVVSSPEESNAMVSIFESLFYFLRILYGNVALTNYRSDSLQTPASRSKPTSSMAWTKSRSYST